MRVALVNLTSGGLSGGYRKYLQALVPLLARHPDVASLRVFVPPGINLFGNNGSVDMESWPARDGVRRFSWLRRRVQGLAPDVVFIPTARWMDCGRIPTVVMIRNMEPLVFPFRANPLGEAVKNTVRALEARRACLRAHRVVAVSNYVKEMLRERWHIGDERIGVVYHGVESPCGVSRAPTWAVGGKQRPFVFTAGSIRPARGLEDLVASLAHLKRNIGCAQTVVIAGEVSPGGAGYRRTLENAAATAGVSDSIIWAGELDRAEMAWCFSNCSAFVMTSRAEACPNLALEAMSYGCLCISVDRPPMPEFFNDVARYYPAGDSAALAAQLRAARVSGDPVASRMKEDAARRARVFDWTITAEKTVAELRLALSS